MVFMNAQKVIKKYLAGLEQGSANNMLELFSSDGIVHSPLYKTISAKKFYQELFSVTKQSKITLLNIFVNDDDSLVAAGHFRYDWVLKDGTPDSFECVDVFKFSSDYKIEEMTIIYDTHKIRAAHEKLKN